MEQGLMILGMALVTFGVRYPVLAILGKLNLPEAVMRALRYVPVAVLTAIVVPTMISPNGTPELSFTNAYLVAGVVSAIIAWSTRKLLPTIVLGMIFFLLWRTLVS
jgi:branched-subunit amino acid transport protein